MSVDNNFSEINKLCNDLYRLKPSFYGATEVERLKEILYANDNYLSYYEKLDLHIDKSLYTFHPKVNIQPIEKSLRTRPSDSYGFYRLGLIENFLRPHLANVNSCHKYFDYRDSRAKAPGGNLNYLANPFWATYGIYSEPHKKTKLAEDNAIDNLDILSYLPNTPNLLATVNVLFGKSSCDNRPVALVSRIYGVNKKSEVPDYPYAQRLVEYLAYVLGYNVMIERNWLSTFRNESGHVISHKNLAIDTMYSPKIESLIYANYKDSTDKFLPIYRYPDINNPKYKYIDKKLYTNEVHEGLYYIRLNNDNFKQSKITGSCLQYSTEVDFVKLLNPLPFIANCGHYVNNDTVRYVDDFHDGNNITCCRNCLSTIVRAHDINSYTNPSDYRTRNAFYDNCVLLYKDLTTSNYVYMLARDFHLVEDKFFRLDGYLHNNERIPYYISKDKVHNVNTFYFDEYSHKLYLEPSKSIIIEGLSTRINTIDAPLASIKWFADNISDVVIDNLPFMSKENSTIKVNLDLISENHCAIYNPSGLSERYNVYSISTKNPITFVSDKLKIGRRKVESIDVVIIPINSQKLIKLQLKVNIKPKDKNQLVNTDTLYIELDLSKRSMYNQIDLVTMFNSILQSVKSLPKDTNREFISYVCRTQVNAFNKNGLVTDLKFNTWVQTENALV
jgi:hypothetical protein